MAKDMLENYSQIQLSSQSRALDCKKFCCQICGNLMKAPLQTYRGNAACSSCYYEAAKRNTDGICPIDKEPISPKQIFKDKAKEREILNLNCFCINQEKGCEWSGVIKDLHRHECDYESKTCSLCGEIMFQNVEIEHQKKCPSLIKAGDCFYKNVGCSFKADTKENMSLHISERSNLHSFYQNNFQKYGELAEKYGEVQNENKALKGTVGDLEKKMKESEEATRMQIAQLKQALFDMAKRIPTKETVEKNNKECDSKVVEKVSGRVKKMSNNIGDNSSNINDLDLRLQLHENTTHDGHLIWKIDNYQKRRNEAITGKITALHSAPCFTSQYGYKFCLRMHLNGDGMGKGTHLSLFLVIMKSEYDNVLEWPFRKQVQFTLINQQNRSNDVVERMVPNKDSSSFQKPRKEMNIASGCPLFVAIDQLDGEGFVKDDSLFIDVKIE